MKILVYSSAAAFGGHELISLKAVDALLEAGHELEFVCAASNVRLVAAATELARRHPARFAWRVQAYHARPLQIVRSWLDMRVLWRLVRLLRAVAPVRVLVLQGDIEQGSEMLVAAWLARVPAVSYVPMVMSGRERGIRLAGLRDLLSRPLYALASRFIVISGYFQRAASVRGARDVRVVFNCVDDVFLSQPDRRAAARASLGVADDECLAGFVGRIAYQQKGLDRLVDMMRRDPAHFRSHRVLIVGNGDDLDRLRADLRTHGLEDGVLLKGWEEAARVAWFDAMDVFLCLSRFEGVPLTILEAISRDVPVLSVPLDPLMGELPLEFAAPVFEAGDFLQRLAAHRPRTGIRTAAQASFVERLRRDRFAGDFVAAVVS